MEGVCSTGEESESDKYGRHHCSAPRFLPHHIKIMKVALALAIIRQKPEGVSAREFTERLALQFSQLQTDWRERAEQLRQELLRTRQELVRFQVQSETLDSTHAGGVQWSDTELQSSGYASSFQPTSQEGEQRTQSTIHQHGEVQNPTTGDQNSRTTAHVKFLSNVSSVLDAGKHLSALTESDLRTAVRDTLFEATIGISEVLSLSALPTLPPSLNNLEAAVQTIVDATKAQRMRPFQTEMVAACETLLKSITGRMAQHRNIATEQEVLSTLVCILSTVPVLYQHAVQQLISAVTQCAEMLSKSLSDISMLDAEAVENVAVIFRTLETLLTKYDPSTLPQEVRLKLSNDLESSVLEVSGTYPLFAYSVWTILAHLSPPTHS